MIVAPPSAVTLPFSVAPVASTEVAADAVTEGEAVDVTATLSMLIFGRDPADPNVASAY